MYCTPAWTKVGLSPPSPNNYCDCLFFTFVLSLLPLQGTSTDSLIMAAKMPEKMGVDEEKKENLVNSLTYVFRLIDLVAQLVEQDQTVYAPHIQE